MIRDIKILHQDSDLISARFRLGYEEDDSTHHKNLAYTDRKDLLSQKIIKLLFTQIGSDGYAPNSGTIFYDITKFYSYTDINNVKTSLPLILSNIEKQIKDSQMADILSGKILDLSEQLSQILSENIEFDDVFGGWIIVLKIITKDNSETLVRFP